MSDRQSMPMVDEDVLVEDDLREPSLYKVFLLNDDYTTMNFVVSVLIDIFHKSMDDAVRIMQEVHEKGMGLCGVYPAEIAETKVDLIRSRARQAGFPLRCTMEEA